MRDSPSGRQLERIIEAVAEGVLVVDAGGRIVYANAAAEAMLGRARADIVGRPFNAPELAAATLAGARLEDDEHPFSKVMRLGEPVRRTGLIIERADGTRAVVSLSASPLRDESGSIMGVVQSFTDTTGCDRIEQVLKRYQLFFEHARDIMLLLRRDGSIVEANSAALAAYGYSREELLSMRIQDVRDPETTPFVERQMAQADTEGILFETVHRRKDGSAFPVEVSSVGAVIDGEHFLLSIIRDITTRREAGEALKESERRFRKMLEEAELIAAILDTKGKVTFANEYLLTLTGWDEAEVIGRAWFDLFLPEDQRGRVRAFFETSVAKDDIQPHYENDIVTKWGERRTILFTNVLLRGSRGEAVGVAFIGEDITERVLAAEEVRRSRRELLNMLESITDGFFGLDNLWRFTYVNQRAAQLIGKRKEDLLFKSMQDVFQETVASMFDEEFRRAKERHVPVVFEAYYEPQQRWLEVHAYPYENGLSVYLSDITERKRAEEALREQAEERQHIEHELRVASKRSEALNTQLLSSVDELRQKSKDLQALLEVAVDITSGLALDEMMARIARNATELTGADVAAVGLIDQKTGVTTYPFIYHLPETVSKIEVPPDRGMTGIVLSSKQPLVVEDYQQLPFEISAFSDIGLHSVAMVPLISHGTTIGTLLVGSKNPEARFGDREVSTLQAIGRHAAIALENARLYEAERNTATILQGALLTVPQQIPGIEFGHLYRSATEVTKVGGDFYDLFEIEHGKVGIVVGDVSGKGLEAATVTTLVKNAAKAFAYQNSSPAAVMANVNEVVFRVVAPANFVTAFFGILDLSTGRLAYCSAGHPPAIVRRQSGVEFLATSSPLIGAVADVTFVDEATTVEKGDVIVVYTDGVVEARCDSGFFGEERLASFIREAVSVAARQLPEAIFDEVMRCAGRVLTDDIAILAISLTPSNG